MTKWFVSGMLMVLAVSCKDGKEYVSIKMEKGTV
jgi:hypothetical protein